MPAPPKQAEMERIRKASRGRDITIEELREQMTDAEDQGISEEEAAERAVVEKTLGMMFRGKACKKDCSGHKKGYAWKQRGKGLKNAKSSSFAEGYNS